MAELVGDAYIRITADTTMMKRALARDMKEAGKDDAGAYVRSFSKQVESTADRDLAKARQTLAQALVDPKAFDAQVKHFKSIEDAAEHWRKKLGELNDQHKIATGDMNVFTNAIKKWEVQAVKARDASIRLAEAQRVENERLAIQNKQLTNFFRVQTAGYQRFEKAQASARREVERAREAEERLQRSRGGHLRGLDRLEHRLGRFSTVLGKSFGKGSRNNFINIIGSVVGGMASAISGVITGIGRAVTKTWDFFADSFGKAFSEASKGGAGFFASVGSGIAGLGSAIVASGPAILIFIGALAAGLVLLVNLIPPLVAMLSLLVGAFTALAGSVTFGLIGGLLALAPAAAGALAGLGAVFGAFLAFFTDKQNKQYVKEFFQPFKDFGKEFQTPVKDFLDTTKSGFKTLFDDITPSVTAFFDSWKKNMGDASTTRGLGAISDSIGRIATTFNTALPQLASGLVGFFKPIMPFAERLATAIASAFKSFDDWANSAGGQSAITEFMDNAWESAKLVWDILKEIGSIIWSVFTEGQPTGDSFLESIRATLQKISDYLKDPANQGKIKQWFADAETIGKQVGEVAGSIGDIVVAFNQPNVRKNATILMNAIVTIAEHAASIAEIADNLLKIAGMGPLMGILGKLFGVEPVTPKGPQGEGPTAPGAVKPPTTTTPGGFVPKSGQKLPSITQPVDLSVNGFSGSGAVDKALTAIGLTPGQQKELAKWTIPIGADPKEWNSVKAIVEMFRFTGKQVPVDGNETEWNQVKGTVAGYAFDSKTVVIKANADPVKAAVDKVRAWLNSLPASKTIRVAGVNSTGGITMAAGGIVNGATNAIVGEAGPEAVVPLDRSLSMVDPAVRQMSAVLQGMTGGRGGSGNGSIGPKVNFEAGAFAVNLPTGDPSLAAEAVLDRLVAYIR